MYIPHQVMRSSCLGKKELRAVSEDDLMDDDIIVQLCNKSLMVFDPLSQIIAKDSSLRGVNLSQKRQRIQPPQVPGQLKYDSPS
jgi:hypothetical protein